MKTLAIKNPERIEADVVLEVLDGGTCDMCREYKRDSVMSPFGHELEGDRFLFWYSKGWIRHFVICFDCITQLSKLIKPHSSKKE